MMSKLLNFLFLSQPEYTNSGHSIGMIDYAAADFNVSSAGATFEVSSARYLVYYLVFCDLRWEKNFQ